MVLAFHGEASLKAAVMNRLREHRKMDEIVQGTYWERGRGCHLGCITHHNSNTHEAAERLFGIEQRIGYWLEAVFEGLPQENCAAWVLESTDAIKAGADLSKCHHHLAAWLLSDASGLLTITDINRAAIERCRMLHERAIREAVRDNEWSAAYSAADPADPAYSAAASAAYSSRSAAYSAADSSRSAANSVRSAAASATDSSRSAADSVRSAAYSAAWQKIAAKSLEIFRNAPLATAQPLTDAVKSELCCKQLWCPEEPLVVA